MDRFLSTAALVGISTTMFGIFSKVAGLPIGDWLLLAGIVVLTGDAVALALSVLR